MSRDSLTSVDGLNLDEKTLGEHQNNSLADDARTLTSPQDTTQAMSVGTERSVQSASQPGPSLQLPDESLFKPENSTTPHGTQLSNKAVNNSRVGVKNSRPDDSSGDGRLPTTAPMPLQEPSPEHTGSKAYQNKRDNQSPIKFRSGTKTTNAATPRLRSPMPNESGKRNNASKQAQAHPASSMQSSRNNDGADETSARPQTRRSRIKTNMVAPGAFAHQGGVRSEDVAGTHRVAKWTTVGQSADGMKVFVTTELRQMDRSS